MLYSHLSILAIFLHFLMVVCMAQHIKFNINGTTSTEVPNIFRAALKKLSNIDEAATNYLSAEDAVKKLESKVGWDPEKSDFIHPNEMTNLKSGINGGTINPVDYDRLKLIEMDGKKMYDLMDIVIPTIRDLDFLEHWKPFIQKFHLIIIQDGDPTKKIKIPAWANYDLYNRKDIEKALKDNSWIISQEDASIRNFGFLISDKKFVYTLDDDCLPAKDASGRLVDSIKEHFINLNTPSTPTFFNTIYDPYRPGSDFVRGYPYSRRAGVPTAVSHGLWMNAYDFDAPTQLLKVHERNTHYVDITLTIPKGQLYPMCSMNVAFNRELIGPAFMQGLMGKGQPWARYDDMFAGWASKVVGDHLNFGTKSGAPYIHHNKASNPFTNLKKEYKGLEWQEILIPFFENLKFSAACKDASSCYLELAGRVQKELSYLNIYFDRLGKAMKIWVQLWADRKMGKLNVVASRSSVVSRSSIGDRSVTATTDAGASQKATSWPQISSMGPNNSDTSCAIFTVTHNENVMLPIWLRYYRRHAALEDIYILDHNSNDGSTSNLPLEVVVIKLRGDDAFMPHYFLNEQVETFQSRLLQAGYPCVLFTEVDEMIIANMNNYKNGLKDYLKEFATKTKVSKAPTVVRASGHDICHISQGTKSEPDVDWSKPLLSQRSYWKYAGMWSKPLLVNTPVKYAPGFHTAKLKINGMQAEYMDSNIVLAHLHNFDYKFCMAREKAKKIGAAKMHPNERSKHMGEHYALFDESTFCPLTKLKNPQTQCNIIEAGFKSVVI